MSFVTTKLSSSHLFAQYICNEFDLFFSLIAVNTLYLSNFRAPFRSHADRLSSSSFVIYDIFNYLHTRRVCIHAHTVVLCTSRRDNQSVTIYFHLIKKTDMLNRWKNKEKATGSGSSNTLPSKGSAKKKRKTGREGGKTYRVFVRFINDTCLLTLIFTLLWLKIRLFVLYRRLNIKN